MIVVTKELWCKGFGWNDFMVFKKSKKMLKKTCQNRRIHPFWDSSVTINFNYNPEHLEFFFPWGWEMLPLWNLESNWHLNTGHLLIQPLEGAWIMADITPTVPNGLFGTATCAMLQCGMYALAVSHCLPIEGGEALLLVWKLYFPWTIFKICSYPFSPSKKQ